MYVFRDGRYAVRGCELLRALIAELCSLPSQATRNSCLFALLRAGELEYALADASEESGCYTSSSAAAAEITDALALRFAANQHKLETQHLVRRLEKLSLPENFYLSRPE